MPLYAPKNTVANWYRYDISGSLELIRGFVAGVESQVEESIEKFQKEKEVHVVEDVPEENHARVVAVHQGLDSEAWDLEGIFQEHFPNLQRRAGLITLCSFFEHELNKLCDLSKRENSYKVSLRDLSGSGIDRAANYLEKVSGIDAQKQSPEWAEIKSIQKIRNLIVHSEGSLKDHEGNMIRAAVEYIKRTETLSGDSDISIGAGYLAHVIDTYQAYCKLLGDSISAVRVPNKQTNQLRMNLPHKN